MQGLDQTRTLSVADIRGAGGQRAEFIARINALRAQIGALQQRASSAMAQGLSAQDYLELSGRLERSGATLAGLHRGYDAAMTHALQRSVAGVEAAIANGRPLPLGQNHGIYRQLANQLQWFSQQAGLQVFSEGSRTGFEGRVAAALLPTSGAALHSPTGATVTRPQAPSTGADAAALEQAALEAHARRLQQAVAAARKEMQQLLPGAGYAQVEEILARVAVGYGVDPGALRAALDSAPAAPGSDVTGPVAGPGGSGVSQTLPLAIQEAQRTLAVFNNRVGSTEWIDAVRRIASAYGVDLQALCHALAPDHYVSVDEAGLESSHVASAQGRSATRAEALRNRIWNEHPSVQHAPSEFKELVLEALENPGREIDVNPSLFSQGNLEYHQAAMALGTYRRILQEYGITFSSRSSPLNAPVYYLRY